MNRARGKTRLDLLQEKREWLGCRPLSQHTKERCVNRSSISRGAGICCGWRCLCVASVRDFIKLDIDPKIGTLFSLSPRIMDRLFLVMRDPAFRRVRKRGCDRLLSLVAAAVWEFSCIKARARPGIVQLQPKDSKPLHVFLYYLLPLS